MKIRPLCTLLAALAAAATAAAQSARWEPAGGTLAVGATASLQLIFEDCAPQAAPPPPKVDGLRMEYEGQSSRYSMINGSYSQSAALTYAVLLSRRQAVDLPSFEVKTDKGPVIVPPAHFEPVGATLGDTRQPLESAARSRLEPESASVWAGQVFALGYSVEADRSYDPQYGRGVVEWSPEPLVAEDWPAPAPFDVRSGGEPRVGLAYRTRAMARKPGTYALKPANQIIALTIGVSGLGFLQDRQMQQFSVASNSPSLEVRPLPPAPAGFGGAVGRFKLTSKVVPATAAVGDPVTWTLELSGTGNWPDIPGLPERAVSKDFQVVQPRAKRTSPQGKLFDATLSEDAVLLPTQEGAYTLGPVRFTFFDPKAGAYQTLTTAPATVTVTAARNTPAPAPTPTAAATTPGPPTLPSGLPRDPLGGSDEALRPIEPVALAAGCAAALLLLSIPWSLLAFRRARATDPQRPRREAWERLGAAAAALRGQTGPAAAPHLRAWQRDTAALWGVLHAAPAPAALAGASGEWTKLWEESDRALYGPDGALPSDWTTRAETARAAARPPGFRAARVLLPRNLLPWLFGAALLLVLPARADTAAAAYARGDFAGAEQAARSTLAQSPTDWRARHDLSLALAQQDRWGEAAAQAAAAFVQHPDDPAVRWQLALACEKAGFAPGPLAAFLEPGPLEELAGHASPAQWQLGLIAAGGMMTVGGLFLLLAGYRAFPPRRAALAGLGLALTALLLGAASLAGWRAYGPAADLDAVVVWRNGALRSVPTEADAAQKTAPLPAGSVARVDGAFLGWVRLSFENGQTGWVRGGEVVRLWR